MWVQGPAKGHGAKEEGPPKGPLMWAWGTYGTELNLAPCSGPDCMGDYVKITLVSSAGGFFCLGETCELLIETHRGLTLKKRGKNGLDG